MKLVQFSLIAAGILLATSAVSAAGATRAERAEIRFLEGMMDHHQMAVDMANDCLTHAADAAVRAICENVVAAQTAEIETMQGWLRDWYGVDYTPVPMTTDSPDGHEMGGMAMPASDPPMMMGMMAGLSQLAGRDYDIAWLESMIDHHDDALHMAERILRQVQHDDLRELANQIIQDQAHEIRTMESLIDILSA